MKSISDNSEYKNICLLASKNDEYFDTFKSNPKYNKILEHVTKEQGELYLNYLHKNFPDSIKRINDYKENDLYGGSKLFQYNGIGEISPSTLRYIKVLSDLKQLFGDLSNKNIIEIGVGYGGQCFIINKEFKTKQYSLLDLDEVLLLNNKYLNKLSVSHKLININDVNSLNEDFDLVISNYAFSELNKELQNLYYEKIIKKSKNGYFTFNFVSHLFGINSYNLDEIMNLFNDKQIKILEESPSTFEKNKILYF
jgi:putative sugar O-methyltransferase